MRGFGGSQGGPGEVFGQLFAQNGFWRDPEIDLDRFCLNFEQSGDDFRRVLALLWHDFLSLALLRCILILAFIHALLRCILIIAVIHCPTSPGGRSNAKVDPATSKKESEPHF